MSARTHEHAHTHTHMHEARACARVRAERTPECVCARALPRAPQQADLLERARHAGERGDVVAADRVEVVLVARRVQLGALGCGHAQREREHTGVSDGVRSYSHASAHTRVQGRPYTHASTQTSKCLRTHAHAQAQTHASLHAPRWPRPRPAPAAPSSPSPLTPSLRIALLKDLRARRMPSAGELRGRVCACVCLCVCVFMCVVCVCVERVARAPAGTAWLQCQHVYAHLVCRMSTRARRHTHTHAITRAHPRAQTHPRALATSPASAKSNASLNSSGVALTGPAKWHGMTLVKSHSHTCVCTRACVGVCISVCVCVRIRAPARACAFAHARAMQAESDTPRPPTLQPKGPRS